MTTNSLAFRLFATAAAWTLLVLPIAGAIIYSLYRAGGRDQLRPPHQRAAHRRPLRQHRPRRERARRAQGRRRAAVRDHAFGLVLADQAARRQARPAARRRARWPAITIPVPSESTSSPTSARCAGPTSTARCEQKLRVAETIYVFGEGKTAQRYSVAVAGTLGEVETSLRTFRTRLDAGAGAGRRRPARRHAVPDPLRPASRCTRWRRAWPPSAPARPPGSTSSCRRRSSRCSRSSTRSSSPTRTSSSARARTSATSRMR